jgi:hypothetical protein
MIVRSLQDRIAFIINIYQDSKFIQSVISTPKICKIYTNSWNSFGIDLGGWAGDYNIQITNFCRILVLLYRIPEHSQLVYPKVQYSDLDFTTYFRNKLVTFVKATIWTTIATPMILKLTS